jgi:glycosyltransferase involved in cell wall biosynthesis
MKIAIDLQGAQGASRLRGIGRYSISLTKAIALASQNDQVIAVLNGGTSEGIDDIRLQLNGIIPENNIMVWYPPAKDGVPIDVWKETTRAIKESFFESLQPDVILVTSVFEDDEQILVTLTDQNEFIPKAVIHYDLIPMMFEQHYLSSVEQRERYYSKLEELKKADLFLAISESSKNEAIGLLGLDSSEVVNISSAADEEFICQELELDSFSNGVGRTNFAIEKDFLLYTGSMDCRKNIVGLIRAFGKTSEAVRSSHQLVIVCSNTKEDREYLQWIASTVGLTKEDVLILGYVSDYELINLYRRCKLFVFPSWHEGFGLPILEAMSCGAAAICSNTSSMPEVLGFDDALFDPFSDEDITQKIEFYCTNPEALHRLKEHCYKRSKLFSWASTGKKALEALTGLFNSRKQTIIQSERKRLAFISPMPPLKSGISDYSLELLPELSKHYDITVVVDNDAIHNLVPRFYKAITADEFSKNAKMFNRVIYHFGNSSFHTYMFDLIKKHAGVVVLHDVYLSHIVAELDFKNIQSGVWAESLYKSHGLNAVIERFQRVNLESLLWELPCSLYVLNQALGVIVHSESSRQLSKKYYGNHVASNIDVIPLLKAPPREFDRAAARKNLGIDNDTFTVCSFGFLGETKLNDKLLDAWLISDFALDRKCKLVFVGDVPDSEYGRRIKRLVRENSNKFNIEITGWTDENVYRQWLQAADVGVQLRTRSRGETSAAVLDCMNYGLATIVNANGSMAEIPSTAVEMLQDDFSIESLSTALGDLFYNETKRSNLGKNAKAHVLAVHQPRKCAVQYKATIEKSFTFNRHVKNIVNAIQPLKGTFDRRFLCEASHAANVTFPNRFRKKRIFLDVSALALHDLRTGIQRVVRAIINNVIKDCPNEYHVELVYADTANQGYRYAHSFFSKTFNVPNIFGSDSLIHYQSGDFFIGLDLHQHVVIAQQKFLHKMRRAGVKVKFVVYDLLPILQPHVFPIQSDEIHFAWLDVIKNYDGAICISKAVADELYEFVRAYSSMSSNKFEIDYFHLGADLHSSVPSQGIPDNGNLILSTLGKRLSFLMVGTIEPRKGYLQVIKAFNNLWKNGIDINLVIVGQIGWKGLAEEYCRDIPETVSLIRNHPELNRRLLFLEGISDEFLEKVYKESDCLIAASYGEGFGLPLIEAAQHLIPIIARDIPVFREVAGDNAFYFDDSLSSDVIARAISDWSSLHSQGIHPKSNGLKWLTWSESANCFLNTFLSAEDSYKKWCSDSAIRFLGNDKRLKSQVGARKLTSIHTTGEEGFLLFGPYHKLSSGAYEVKIEGKINFIDGTEWFDIACDSGNLRLLHCHFRKSSDVGDIILTGVFNLDHPVNDFELRVYVNRNSDMTINLLELKPFSVDLTVIQNSVITDKSTFSDSALEKKDGVLINSESHVTNNPVKNIPVAINSSKYPAKKKRRR